MQKILLLLFAPFFLTACQGEIENFLGSTQTIEVTIYQNEKASIIYTLTDKDLEYQSLKQWLKRNKTGWQSSPASYLPSVTVTGNDFSMNFINDLVIINFNDKQYTKKVTKKEYTYLIKTST